MTFLDPDRRLFSRDKAYHLLGSFALAIGALLIVYWAQRLHLEAWAIAGVAALLVGIVFELGQWDAARGTSLEGQVGYGFGLLDLLADAIGIGLALLLWAFR